MTQIAQAMQIGMCLATIPCELFYLAPQHAHTPCNPLDYRVFKWFVSFKNVEQQISNK